MYNLTAHNLTKEDTDWLMVVLEGMGINFAIEQTKDTELWYAHNHPSNTGLNGICTDCGKPYGDQIHDDPSAGQDFDWKWGDPT